MASNLSIDNHLIDPFNLLNLNEHNPTPSKQIDHGQIETILQPNFQKLDQIIEFKSLLLIIDWKNDNCIHVLNSASLTYLKEFRLDRSKGFIHWMEKIELDQEDFLAVLLERAVCFLQVDENNGDLEILNYHDLHLDYLNRKGSRPYGLVYNSKKKYIYFLETNSRKLIRYKLNRKWDRVDLEAERIFKLNLSFNGSFRSYLREMKLDENRLFLIDYKAKNGEGNGCVHLLDLNARYLSRFGQGLLHSPYSIELDPNDRKTVFVCEKISSGKIFVFNEIGENCFQVVREVLVGVENPYFFAIHPNKGFCYLTHVMGDEYKYDGRPELYRFKYELLLN